MRHIKYIVIHCTAGYGDLASILYYWRIKLGWTAPGYHYVIDLDGIIHPVWPIAYPTNGVKGYNSESLHIAYIGGVHPQDYTKALDTRTKDQKAAILHTIYSVLEELKKHQDISEITIPGHRDFSPDKNKNGIVDSWERIKECPSFDAIPEYRHITKH